MLAASAATMVAACQTTTTETRTTAAPGGVPPTPPPQPPAVQSAAFDAWLAQAQAEALSRGISKATVDAALFGIAPIPRVVELDRRQPEFTQTFARYLGNAVTQKRITDGQAMLQTHAALLRRLEAEYGIPPRFLVAFWGLETNYGKGMGSYPVINALATLAYDGRRAAFFRTELFNALQILDGGHIAPGRMIGSWAGAMGHTQFMPSTFLRHAVDADGDGRKDIWGNVSDALASAANYLRALGWDGSVTWGREVLLPTGFDVGLASIDTNATETVLPLTAWTARGVTQTSGAPLPQKEIPAALVLPSGHPGPAFLVYENYRAILKWNRSTLYALAVGHLSDRLIGGQPLYAAPSTEEPLRREESIALQQGLQQLGFLTAEADGVIGAATRQAVRAFQRANNLPADGYPTRAILAAVTERLTAQATQ